MSLSISGFFTLLEEVITENVWLNLLQLYFQYLFRLDNTTRESYFLNCEKRFRGVFQDLSSNIYCSNCKSLFTLFDSLGSKTCSTHVGQLEQRGYGLIWSCCERINKPLIVKSAALSYAHSRATSHRVFTNPEIDSITETTRIGAGCRKADHWDLSAVNDKTHTGSIAGYNEISMASIPLLVYMKMIYWKVIKAREKSEIRSMLQSISLIEYTNNPRKKFFDPTDMNRPNVSKNKEDQRNYDPFFFTSSSSSNFLTGYASNSDLTLKNTRQHGTRKGVSTIMSTQSIDPYLDHLFIDNGIAVIEKHIQNQTLPLNADILDTFMFNHIIILSRITKSKITEADIVKNFQDVFLVDLLTTCVSVKRTE